jgi:hypothetical protein
VLLVESRGVTTNHASGRAGIECTPAPYAPPSFPRPRACAAPTSTPLRTLPFAVSGNTRSYFDAGIRAAPQTIASQRGDAQVGCSDAKFKDRLGSQLATAVAFETGVASRPGVGFRLSSVLLLLKVCKARSPPATYACCYDVHPRTLTFCWLQLSSAQAKRRTNLTDFWVAIYNDTASMNGAFPDRSPGAMVRGKMGWVGKQWGFKGLVVTSGAS